MDCWLTGFDGFDDYVNVSNRDFFHLFVFQKIELNSHVNSIFHPWFLQRNDVCAT
jgi:hypothetical protein